MRDLHPHSRGHPAVPADVDDILLWRLAVDVAAAHQPGHHGRCSSPLCADEPAYPCRAATAAQRAAHAARRPTLIARGRAAVPPPAVAVGRAAPIDAATAVGRPCGAGGFEPDVWPPPLRRPAAGHAA